MADHSLAFAPFYVWKVHTSNILLSLVRSFILPISLIVVNWKKIKSKIEISFAVVVQILALFQAIMLVEVVNGSYSIAGNNFWGSHMALYLLMLSSLIYIFSHPVNYRPFFYVLIGLHFLSGLIYVSKIAVGMNYY